MTFARPSVDEERWIEVRSAARAWKRMGWIESNAIEAIDLAGWKTSSILPRLAFALLTLVGIGGLAGFNSLMRVDRWEWVTAVLCCLVAEALVDFKRFLRTGIEETLLIAGLFLFIFGIRSEPRPEGMLLFAGASAIASWRLLNPWFGALASIFLIVYAHQKSDEVTAGVAALVVALVTLLLMSARFRRPYLDVMVSATAMVATGLVWGFARAGEAIHLVWAGLSPVVALAVFISYRFRLTQAGYVAAIAFGLLALEISRIMTPRVDYRLMLGGFTLLIVSALIERLLRTPRRGVTSRSVVDRDFSLFEMGAIGMVAPSTAPEATPPRHEGGGGQFGGGGASGDY